MGSNIPSVTLMMGAALVCTVIFPYASGAILPPSVFAQQEEPSLGDDLTGAIMSDVLDVDSSDDDYQEAAENDNGGDNDAEPESNQEARISSSINPNQEEQIVDQDNFLQEDADNIGLQGQEQEQGAANLDQNAALDQTIEPRPTPTPLGDGLQSECSLEITADKEIYGPGDVVVVTVTNAGEEPLDFPNSALGLQIKNVDTREVFPIESAQVVTTLEPGESKTFEFTYEELVSEIGTGLISATVVSECGGRGALVEEEVNFRLSVAPPENEPP
jgi:hypothetical protein